VFLNESDAHALPVPHRAGSRAARVALTSLTMARPGPAQVVPGDVQAADVSLGLEDAGFRVAVAADHDPWAVQTHAANFRGLSARLDLSDPTVERHLVELLQQAEITLIASGPPCQPFSRAGRSAIRSLVAEGRRESHDDRRDLLVSVTPADGSRIHGQP
jgi:hypothetical protein